jgi:hypothetical protein
MSNYGRFLQVSAGGSTWGIEGVTDQNPGLRVRFNIKLFAQVSLNTATVKITNLKPEIAHGFVTTPDQPITIDAGYQDSHGVIFKGTIRQAVYGRDNPTDTVLTLYCSDGDMGHNFGVVNKSHVAGSTPHDHVTSAVNSMPGLSLGYLDPALQLTQPKYPKSVQLYGMARNVLDKVAGMKGANWSIQQGQVQMVGYKNPLPGGQTILNTHTGLIGMPTQEIGGIMARALINPNIKIYSSVNIDQALIQGGQYENVAGSVEASRMTMPYVAADGVYKVLGIAYEGDSRGNPWYMDMTCLAPATIAGAPGAGIMPDNKLLKAALGEAVGTAGG